MVFSKTSLTLWKKTAGPAPTDRHPREAHSHRKLCLTGSNLCRRIWSYYKKRKLTARKCFMSLSLNGLISRMMLSGTAKSLLWRWSKVGWLNTSYLRIRMSGIWKTSKLGSISMICSSRITPKSSTRKDSGSKIRIKAILYPRLIPIILLDRLFHSTKSKIQVHSLLSFQMLPVFHLSIKISATVVTSNRSYQLLNRMLTTTARIRLSKGMA